MFFESGFPMCREFTALAIQSAALYPVSLVINENLGGAYLMAG